MGGKLWANEEIEYLEEKYGILTSKSIAKALNRTVKSVELKVSRLGLGPYIEHRGLITVNELASICRKSRITIYSWINSGLKAKQLQKTAPLGIEINDFWKWAEKNKEKINFSNIEHNLLGKEPKWVVEQRKLDYIKIPKNQRKFYTKEEDKILIDMHNKRKIKDIAEYLQRSEESIKHRISRLKEKNIIKKTKICLKWTSKEVEILVNMKDTHTYDEIAEELGRSNLSVAKKIFKLRRKYAKV